MVAFIGGSAQQVGDFEVTPRTACEDARLAAECACMHMPGDLLFSASPVRWFRLPKLDMYTGDMLGVFPYISA